MPKSAGKLRLTVVVEWKVDDLSHYKAETLEEAAKFTAAQLESGDAGFDDALSWGTIEKWKVEPVK